MTIPHIFSTEMPRKLTLNGPSPVRPGKTVTYICRVQGGKPAPILRWSLGHSAKPLTSQVEGFEERSDVTVTIKKGMNGKTLKCEASLYDRVISEEKTLDVRCKCSRHHWDWWTSFRKFTKTSTGQK